MASTEGLGVQVQFGASMRGHGRLGETEFTEAIERHGFSILNEISEGFLFIANEGEEPTVVPDELTYLIAKVCFDSLGDVLTGGHYHLDSMSHMGSMDLVREEDLTLIGGGEFAANYFPTDALLVALYRCGERFVRLLERIESERDSGHGIIAALRDRERGGHAALERAGLL